MRAKLLEEGLTLLLILGGLFATVGCGQSAALISSEETPDTQTAVTPAAELLTTVSADAAAAACCEAPLATEETDAAEMTIQEISGGIVLPEITLLNQEGESVRFHSELVKDKIVVINFVFTTCKGVCPPMGANYAQLQRRLGDRYGDDVALISVSVDPTIDTPQRLKAWREKFGGGSDWTLLTGSKQDVDHLLKALEVFTADKNDHSPFILLGDEAAGKWRRVHGLTAPDQLAEIIAGLHADSQAGQPSASETTASEDATDAEAEEQSKLDSLNAEPVSAPSVQTELEAGRTEQTELPSAQKYFTNVEMVNQHSESMRFYSDVLKGKVVVINSFFATCKGSCPVMMASFAKIQEQFADRLGKDLYIISITVDPNTDTPELLASYAEQWNAKPGWLFLTGEKANVDAALYKLGHYVENKESHSNVFIIGNEATGLWKKARGLSKPEALFPLIEEVLNDRI